MKGYYEFYINDFALTGKQLIEDLISYLTKNYVRYHNFDINFSVTECVNACVINFTYCDDLFLGSPITVPVLKNDFLNIRIFKHSPSSRVIIGSRQKIFDIMYGLLRELISMYKTMKLINPVVPTKAESEKFLDKWLWGWRE